MVDSCFAGHFHLFDVVLVDDVLKSFFQFVLSFQFILLLRVDTHLLGSGSGNGLIDNLGWLLLCHANFKGYSCFLILMLGCLEN